MIANKQKYVNHKHYGFEIIAAFSNVILRESKSKSVATVLDFEESNKRFKINTGKAISKSIKHGFKQQLKPGVEGRYHIDKP